MTRMRCIPGLLAGRRKKRVVADAKKASGDCLKVKPVEFIDSPAAECGDGKVAPCDVKVVVDDTVVTALAATKGGGGGDDHGGDMALAKRGSMSSDFEFEFHAHEKPDGHGVPAGASPDAVIASGKEVVVADASPKLKRSCSNIETKRPGAHDAAAEAAPARSRSYGDLGNLPGGVGGGISLETTPRGAAPQAEASPASVRTSRTADRVMLKKRSSSQVLPSRSRKLWWRLFLWSHRNLHRPSPAARPAAAACTPAGHHGGGGYTSDTLEEGPAAAAADRKNKKVMVDDSPPIPNQWVAFSADNSLHDRISAWVNSIDNDTFRIAEEDNDDHHHHHYHGDADDDDGEHAMEHGDCVARAPRALEIGESSGKGHGKSKRSTAADEVAQANTIIQSLNAFSSVAHISGMGLKVVPMIAPFSSLRAVNLSGNFIVHISPGSLPKGLHSLDLSRNKIANIEGLRELTKLRVLNLSYNRISRIGHGLSGCTALRELYLAGNKISDVEGLHRLLKLAVLDLGFNKVTTARALGQLVANYHSLRALNLVGNPVQANVGDDALRRAVTGLLPHLAYLNKQPVKPRGAAPADGAVSRAALEAGGAGGGSRSAQKRSSAAAASRRLGQRGEGSGSGRSRSKGRQPSSSLPARR
ncbi:uncharacterized protein LOC127752514 [Oryza glaberrima]|uniref:Uncharacterized protein n=1 Tax=Oryza glaberrima TaxID=4538 RepID=I1QTY8_ORYGL|nr:uncharacterized protein LOC127752514 [Oryza glaberrima]XP_052133878.1 uncharacterized protein LOC127752514 [Oryza glaberrima]